MRLNTKEQREAQRISMCRNYTTVYNADADCYIATNDRQTASGKMNYDLMIFDGTAGNPCANYYFRTVEARDRYIQQHIDSRKSSLERKAEYKAKKKAEGKYKIDYSKPYFLVGRKYSCSWGYDGDDFSHTIKVISRSDCFLTVCDVYGNRECADKPYRIKVGFDGKEEYLSPKGSFEYYSADKSLVPTDEEIAAMKEQERIEQEKADAERLAAREAEFQVIKDIIENNPINDSDKYNIHIHWVEGYIPLGDYIDGLDISVMAAEKIFKLVDDTRAAESTGGYEKWKFSIISRSDGAEVWIDRYDMGDNYGGLIAFMGAYREQQNDETNKLVDELELLANGIVSISIAPEFQSCVYELKAESNELYEAMSAIIEVMTVEELLKFVQTTYSSGSEEDMTLIRFLAKSVMERDSIKGVQFWAGLKKIFPNL